MEQSGKSTFTESSDSLKILFAASEAQPLIKTGGLGDVAGSLPMAMRILNHDVRLILPAYPQAIERAIPLHTAATLHIPGFPGEVRLLEGKLAESLPLYLVDAPGLFDRPGNPYSDAAGHDWGDNAQRFALFCRVVAMVAMNQAELNWKADMVHCNDWQTGLVPALLSEYWNRPTTLFTIHNLSYQGVFPQETFTQLHLPSDLWSPDGLEFHDDFSFIKGGLAFSDWITTVSPTYADEIRTPEFGYGLEGLINHRSDRLAGILNGIDYQEWDPSTDPNIHQHYDAGTFELKKLNKLRLQREMGLAEDEDALLFGHIGRTVPQKGIDLILEILPILMEKDKVQLVVLGAGDSELEQALREEVAYHPEKSALHIGYDEQLAHRIEASCDAFLMPSRYEPCGLNQLYSLRYGTVPVVHRTGGLADTVVDVQPRSVLDGSATGFVFDRPEGFSLLEAVERTIEYYHRPGVYWNKLAIRGMQQDFSWRASAQRYLDLYRQAIDHPAPNPVA
jgi:starch synthase